MSRLAGRAQRHRWTAVVLWLAVLAATVTGSTAAGDAYRNDFSLRGTESQQVVETLEDAAPAGAGASVTVVFQHDDGLDAAAPHVTAVEPPVAGRGSLSADGTVGYATLALDVPSERMPVEDTRSLLDAAGAAEGAGLQVAVGGDPVSAAEEPAE